VIYHFKSNTYDQGRIQKFPPRERGFEIFFYGRENLGGFWDFFLKKPQQIEKISQREPLPEYAPAYDNTIMLIFKG